jgi:predicted transcriptional regulator
MPTNTSKKPNTQTSLERVYRAIRRRRVHGATSDEIEALLGLSHQNVSARINELFYNGVLEVTGLTRTTRNGRPANVYFAVPPQRLEQYVEG